MITHAKVSIMVKDIDKAISFYTKKLGFKGEKWGDDFAYLTGSGIALGLSEDKDSKYYPDKGNLSLGFEVKDLDKAAAELKKKGLSFEFDEDEDCRFAFFEDLDGTPLYLVEKKD